MNHPRINNNTTNARKTFHLEIMESFAFVCCCCWSCCSFACLLNSFFNLVFFRFGLPPAIFPRLLSFKSLPFLPNLGLCRAIAPADPAFANPPSATRFFHAECPPIGKRERKKEPRNETQGKKNSMMGVSPSTALLRNHINTVLYASIRTVQYLPTDLSHTAKKAKAKKKQPKNPQQSPGSFQFYP